MGVLPDHAKGKASLRIAKHIPRPVAGRGTAVRASRLIFRQDIARRLPMTKKAHKDEAERQPATEERRLKLDDKAREAEAHLRRAEAALREQPEDLRETARETTPAGKGRSQ
jgi:hypothetical protein